MKNKTPKEIGQIIKDMASSMGLPLSKKKHKQMIDEYKNNMSEEEKAEYTNSLLITAQSAALFKILDETMDLVTDENGKTIGVKFK